MGMKQTVYMICLGGKMRNPFRTIRAIAEHVTKCACRPYEWDIWLYFAAQRHLHKGITYERFQKELTRMVDEGVLRYDSWNGYSRVDYGWH
jgi:hypothetical protein